MVDPTSEDIAEVERPAELVSRIDKLQAAADEVAGEVRNLYIAFLSFGLYLAVTVGATTDEQLLRESPVRLPIVDVGLPLIAFYWIAPLLFVLFHFNLLMQLYLLSEKLDRLDLALGQLPADEQGERRATLSQFVFSQMLLGGHRSRLIRMLLQAMGWTTLVVLPIAVLLLTQIQFLPYHGPFTTWWHRFLITADLLLLWQLWLPAIDATDRLDRQVRVVMRQRIRRFLRWLAEPLDWPAWPIIGFLWLIRAAPTLPGSLGRRLFGDPKRDWRLLRLQELSAVSLLMAFLVATIPGSFLAWPIGSLTERGNIGVLNRDLALREAQLVLERPPPGLAEDIGEEAAFENCTRGLDLHGRDLRSADLTLADLRKADLRDSASLQGAYLVSANLQGAKLGDADLQGAQLTEANLQGANLEGANLQGGLLGSAQLQGAKLVRANLQGAKLGGANMQGADLAEAILHGVSLNGANLQGAILGGANLQGADLASAQLQGANLVRANLQGAKLGGANLQGADLAFAQLQGAYLGANVQGADLRDANLWRATEPAQLHLADLRGVRLDPVDWMTLIAEMRAQIAHEATRTEVIEALQFRLRSDDVPDLPSWQGQPNVMFEASDPIPQKLKWKAPAMTGSDYDEKLATFLGDLACGDDVGAALVQGIAWRATPQGRFFFDEDELVRPLYRQLAQRLTPDDPQACPAAGALPEDLRAEVELIADRRERPLSDQAEPEPAPPEAPLQGPQPFVPYQ